MSLPLLSCGPQIDLTIQNQQVQFLVQPTEASVLAVSREFCINNQAALGIQPLTEQSLPRCQQPLVDALVQAVRTNLSNAAAAKEARDQVAEVKVAHRTDCFTLPRHDCCYKLHCRQL